MVEKTQPKEQNVEKDEGVQAQQIGVKTPRIVHLDTIKDERGKEYYRIKREDGKYEIHSRFIRLIKDVFRHDLDEMFEVDMQLYGDRVGKRGHDLIHIAMDYLCMMYDPDKVKFLLDVNDPTVTRWMLYENCGVYVLTITNSSYEFYLCEKEYQHGYKRLTSMLDVKLVAHPSSILGKNTVRKNLRQREKFQVSGNN